MEIWGSFFYRVPVLLSKIREYVYLFMIPTLSLFQLFCPKTIEVKMNDPQQHKFMARIAHSVSRVGRRLGGFNRDTNTRQINGFRQIWPLENRGPQERIPDVSCPSENDPNACPSEFMTAYETSSHQSMNCAFT